ncbi:hypothetical protein KP806_15920 [Paenibacillus sp. N4]|uniref:hypothetical protein n=1 Tax=Paenibacillus vietnamensis TaxID=2590547 RepID=UPI001CD0463F|nr:hypothetical protein [Paenibacillus vietnamensis]MCA0756543.1 hypothetical protein [Paenibacillus vietnamensis]
MVVVLFVLFAWFCIHVWISLPHKLPLAVNFLLFMAIEIMLTNKLTVIGYDLQLFIMNQSIPHFLSLIIHNDLTVPFILLAFANTFLTTRNARVRWGISVYAVVLQFATGYALRWNDVITDNGWNFLCETLMIILLMAYTLLAGRILQIMAAKEGWMR